MTPRFSRRSFLKSTLAAGAALTILPGGSARTYAANEKVNVGIIGSGGQGGVNRLWLKRVGANIVALCDVDFSALAKALKDHEGAQTCADYRLMLEKQKEIDAVMISTADHTHYPASMLAMKLGKHVCTEKPLCHSLWEARQLALAARQYKVVTQLDNENHSTEGMHVIVEMLRSGAIGTVKEAHIWTDRPIWPQGLAQRPPTKPVPANLDWDLWIGPAPFRAYHDHLHPFAWRGWWDFGCGALGDMGCHFWDSAFWGLDLGQPTSVEAEQEGNSAETFPKWSIITYQFPQRPRNPQWDPPNASDARQASWGPITVKWYDGHKLPPKPEEMGPDEKLPPNGSLFVGDKAKLLINDAISPRLLPETYRKQYAKPAPFLARAPQGDHKIDWLDAIKAGGGKHSNDDFAEYGGPLTEVVLLGNLAIRAGKKIEWDAANLKATNAPELGAYIKREYRKGWEV